MRTPNKMTLAELAGLLNYEYVGDPDLPIESIAYAKAAGPRDLAIAHSARDIPSTRAEVVLTRPCFLKTFKALLYCPEAVGLAAVKAAQILLGAGVLPDYNAPAAYAPTPEGTMLGENVSIGEGTVIQPFCVIGRDVRIGRRCVLEPHVWIGSGVELGDDVFVHAGAKVGVSAFFHYKGENLRSFPGVGTVRVGDSVEIGSQSAIQRGTFSDTVIGPYTKIGDFVEIGHDVQIGRGCKIVSQTGIAGNVTIGNSVLIYGQAGIANNVTIGDRAVIMAKSRVSKNILPGQKISGMFGRTHWEEMRFQVKLKRMLEEK